MPQIPNPFKKIRVVYRRSSTKLKCVVLATILLSGVSLVALRFAIVKNREDREEMRAQAAAMEQENQQLEKDISQMGTIEGIKRIAQQELGLVDPQSQFFTPAQ